MEDKEPQGKTYRLSLTWVGEVDPESAKMFKEDHEELFNFLTENDDATLSIEEL